MDTNSEKYVLTELTSTIKHLAETENNLTEQIKTPTAKNARLTSNNGHQKNKTDTQIQEITMNKSWIQKDIAGCTRITCTKRNDGNMEKSTRADTMVGSTRNSGCVLGSRKLGGADKNNVIEMYHYVNNIGHPHTIDITIKSGLADARASGTYIRPKQFP